MLTSNAVLSAIMVYTLSFVLFALLFAYICVFFYDPDSENKLGKIIVYGYLFCWFLVLPLSVFGYMFTLA
jgi:hypothetical protein|nr:MAG TPA_asm: hypothetical protein [Caudoviricetes sp.]